MNETTKRILELMKKKGDTPHSLEVNAKLPTSSVYSWKTNKFKPSMDSIIKLAKYFNVSADYLLCLPDEPTSLKKADIIERPDYALSTELAELTQDERFVNSAKIYKELPNECRQEIYAYILGVALGLGLNVHKILKR